MVAAAPSSPPYLNDPAALSQGITVNSVSASALDYTVTSGSVASYAVPVPPPGSVVEFDINCTSTTYFRLDLEGDMTTPNFTELVTGGIPTGTTHISVTLPYYTSRAYIGFRSPTSSQTVQITNWRVTTPSV